MNLLEKAIGIALEAHAGHKDRAGRPYILHPLHLMMQMETEEEMITAVLHDVVEDSNITLDDLAAAGFSAGVLTAVALLTRDKSSDDYEAYIAAIKPDPLARRVKLADLAHNMELRRQPTLDDKDWQRFEKYFHAWNYLNYPD